MQGIKQENPSSVWVGRVETKASRFEIRLHVPLACTCPCVQTPQQAAGLDIHAAQTARGAGPQAQQLLAGRRAARGRERGTGKASELPQMPGIIPLPFGKPVPPPPAAAAQLQLRIPPPWPPPHRSRPRSPNLPPPSRLRPARRMTRSWGNSEGRWPGGRKPRKVGPTEAASNAGTREPRGGGPPGSAGRASHCPRVAFRAPDRAGVLARPQTEPRLWVTVVPEPRPSRSPAPSARPLSPPSARPRAGICQVAAGKFSPAPSLPALCLHWFLQRRRFPGAFRSFTAGALASLYLSGGPLGLCGHGLYQMFVD